MGGRVRANRWGVAAKCRFQHQCLCVLVCLCRACNSRLWLGWPESPCSVQTLLCDSTCSTTVPGPCEYVTMEHRSFASRQPDAKTCAIFGRAACGSELGRTLFLAC